MITKEKFIDLMSRYNKNEEYIDEVEKYIPSFFELPVVDFGWYCFDELLRCYFTTEGVDWIDYYLFENSEHCYYQDDEKIPLKNIDALWKLIEPYRK